LGSPSSTTNPVELELDQGADRLTFREAINLAEKVGRWPLNPYWERDKAKRLYKERPEDFDRYVAAIAATGAPREAKAFRDWLKRAGDEQREKAYERQQQKRAERQAAILGDLAGEPRAARRAEA
jgi:hypothetical protein